MTTVPIGSVGIIINRGEVRSGGRAWAITRYRPLMRGIPVTDQVPSALATARASALSSVGFRTFATFTLMNEPGAAVPEKTGRCGCSLLAPAAVPVRVLAATCGAPSPRVGTMFRVYQT